MGMKTHATGLKDAGSDPDTDDGVGDVEEAMSSPLPFPLLESNPLSAFRGSNSTNRSGNENRGKTGVSELWTHGRKRVSFAS